MHTTIIVQYRLQTTTVLPVRVRYRLCTRHIAFFFSLFSILQAWCARLQNFLILVAEQAPRPNQHPPPNTKKAQAATRNTCVLVLECPLISYEYVTVCRRHFTNSTQITPYRTTVHLTHYPLVQSIPTRPIPSLSSAQLPKQWCSSSRQHSTKSEATTVRATHEHTDTYKHVVLPELYKIEIIALIPTCCAADCPRNLNIMALAGFGCKEERITTAVATAATPLRTSPPPLRFFLATTLPSRPAFVAVEASPSTRMSRLLTLNKRFAAASRKAARLEPPWFSSFILMGIALVLHRAQATPVASGPTARREAAGTKKASVGIVVIAARQRVARHAAAGVWESRMLFGLPR